MSCERWKKNLMILLIFCGLALMTWERIDIYSSSMEPAYVEGDVLLVDKLSFRLGGIHRYDVVVFGYNYENALYYVKRVIGMPGETVQIVNGEVWIDGVRLDDPFADEEILDPGRVVEPIILDNDEYFVLGDNRNNSSDSRDADIGSVTRDQVVGTVTMRLWHKEKNNTDESFE